ncbi:sigma 54-interacting transcriptional regulator [Clostridiaceae bacterium 35-E11]
MEKYIREILEIILEHIDEGVHVIDNEGRTIIYNHAMTELEGMEVEDVLNKKLLDVFPSLNKESSTLLRVLRTEEKLINHPQTYLNNYNKEITTINTTLPIILKGTKVGALEIAKNITKIKHLSDQIMSLQSQLAKPEKQKKHLKRFTFDSIIGENKDFIKAINYAKKAAEFSSSVLIYGETGTGKELVAQSIHYSGPRAPKTFLAQNCAAIPETLLEGILFGTVKGSFTGAVDRPGLFEQANGGTIFLDEINSMGLQLQSKLLRVLQEGTIRRIGALKDIPIDVRIIASTNEEPYEAIEKGRLRKDLFYRINVISINLPPLRERKDDIEQLTYYFIHKHNKKFNKKVEKIDSFVLDAFERYKWPGNIRELENTLEGAMNIVGNEKILRKEHFSPQIHAKIFALPYQHEYKVKENLTHTLEVIEKDIITGVLTTCDYNISEAARQLGIKRQTLQHKLKKLNIGK